MGNLDIQAYLSITRYHIPSQWASVKGCLVDTQDLQHHQPVVTRTHHSVVLMEDTRGTVMRHFYPSQPESYQGSISGEPEILHSLIVTMSTISLKCQWIVSGGPGLLPDLAIIRGHTLHLFLLECCQTNLVKTKSMNKITNIIISKLSGF